MVLLTRRGAQDRAASYTSCQEITKGRHVVVLDGRHFQTFGAGDEGVVIRVDPEAQNCEVLFAGKSQPMTVALRHLRALAQDGPSDSCDYEARSMDDGPSPINSSNGAWSVLASLVRGADETADDTPPPSHIISPQRGFNNTPRNSVAAKEKPVEQMCDFMETAPALATGGAAASVASTRTGEVSNGSTPQNGAIVHRQLLESGGVVSNYDRQLMRGQPQQAVSHFPASLTQPLVPAAPPLWTGQSSRPRGVRSSGHTCAQQQCHFLNHGLDQPLGVARPVSLADPASVAFRDARLATLEARLQNFKDEHREEVSSLRHALEECVRAIATCARSIDSMCFDDGPSQFQGSANFSEWGAAATALHDAAELGRRALGRHSSVAVNAACPCNVPHTGEGICGSQVTGFSGFPMLADGNSNASRAASRAGSRPASARRMPARAGSSSGLWHAGNNVGPLASGDAVAYHGAMAIGAEGAARRATSGPPDNRYFSGTGSRPFLVATPRQCGLANPQYAPFAVVDHAVMPEFAEQYGTPLCAPESQWANHSDRTSLMQQPQLQHFLHPVPGAHSGFVPPANLLHGLVRLEPPANLLGSIPGLSGLDAGYGLHGPPPLSIGGACNGSTSLGGASASAPPGHLGGAAWLPVPA